MTKTKFEVMDICNKHDIPVGPILSMKEIAEEQSLRDTGTVVEVDHPTRGKYLTVGNPGEDVGLDHRGEALAAARRAHRGNPDQGARLFREGARRDQELRRDHAAGRSRPRRRKPAVSASRRKAMHAADRAIASPEPSGVYWMPASAAQARDDNRVMGGKLWMRIVVHGQQAFGKAVLEALLKRGENVVAVYVAPEKPGAEGRSAQGSGARREAAGLSAGLLPQAGGVGGVPRAQARPAGDGLRDAVRAGGIPQHPDPRLDPVSPLAAAGLSRRVARSTGRSSMGEKETGLSIFWPDNGLDTGDVLLQKKTPISATDTLGTVYFDRLFPMGVEAMLESVDLVKAGKAPRIKQDESKATYEGRCGAENAHIDWGKSWRQIDPLIRGCNPAPGAWSTLDGKTLQDFRRQAAAGEGPQGHRRQDGRDRRGREPTASPWSAPTAASRSRACSPHGGKKIDAGELGDVRQARRRRAVLLISRSQTLNHLLTDLHSTETTHARLAASPIRNPTSKSPRPPRSGRSSTSPREKLGIARGEPRALRPLQGQGVDGLHQVAQGQAERQADPGLGDHADAGRRRQDHHHGRPHRRAQPHRQEGDAVPARAVARARRSA